MGWLNLEYRLLMGGDNRVFAFYDFGDAEVPGLSTKEGSSSWDTRHLQGYGAGMQIESRLGLVNLSLAFSPGKGLSEGRLHIELAERF